MLVVGWILFIIFVLFWIGGFTTSHKTARQWMMLYFDTFVVAIAAGIIWGGLFR